ncbi:MAG: TrbI/VirB10 family protein [Luteimonas sp.]
MNQNMPPDRDTGAGDNPYYANQSGASAQDLDANAPLLKSNDLQRLNRKALLFLAGIIALLIVMAIWLVSSAASGDDIVKPREETVVIPELPRDSTNAAEAAPPIEVAEYAPPDMDTMPPLPVESSPQPAYISDYPAPLSSSSSSSSSPRALTLRERRMNNMVAGEQVAGGVDPYVQAALAGFPGNPASPPEEEKMPASAEASSAQFINNPDALLVRGTYLRCVLETRIITDVPGFTSCILTEPTYSINGRRLLLPKGSKIYGRYNNTDPEKPRIAVVWDRITTPNGIDVSMASPGVDGLGSAGYRGDYDAHWASRITSALLISLISDAFKYAGAEYGPTTTSISNGIITQAPFESNTARTMERLANQALDRTARRPATVTINQGTVVNVYVAKDVDFSSVLASR